MVAAVFPWLSKDTLKTLKLWNYSRSFISLNELPPVPAWKELGEVHEVVGFGTIFYQDNEPKVHLHAAFGKGDSVKVGCLREKSRTFLVLEAVIIELSGINAVRAFDPASGVNILKL